MPDPATAYAEAVVAGEILTGELVRLACERHLRDRDNQVKLGLFWDTEAVTDLLEFASLHHHYKGRWAKEKCTCGTDEATCAKRIIFLPWQEFCGGSIVGWKRQNADGQLVRRFDTATIQVARKNGKTHFAAPIVDFLTFFDGEPGAEAYVAAAAGHQARYVHDIFKSIVRASPFLREMLEGYNHKLANISDTDSESFIQPVSSESDNLDALSPHVILLDELHAHRDSGVRDTLRTGTGSREEPLTLQISTAGEEREDSVMKSERDYGEGVLRGDIEDESVFAYIAEFDKGDDWTDLSVYHKANPSLGATIRIEDLQRDLEEAIAKPLVRNAFKIKRANMWLSVFSGMFDAEAWRKCDTKLDLEDLRGRPCFGGIDLAQKVDMSALALVWPPTVKDEFWRALLHYWIPAATLTRKAMKDKPLERWHKQGLIEVAGGSMIDFAFIRKRINELAERFAISEIGFDPWKATQLAQELQGEGHMMIEVRQGHRTLSAATDELGSVVADGRFSYDSNPVLRWNAKNSVAREDENGNRIPSKKRSRGNIDGISATIIAMSRALAGTAPASIYNPGAPATGRSVYNE